MRPSCGARVSAMFHLRHHLDAHGHRRPIRLVEGSYLAQHPIDAIADAQEALLRLEVDIGGAALDRVREERRNEAHDRLRIGVAGRLQALVIDLSVSISCRMPSIEKSWPVVLVR